MPGQNPLLAVVTGAAGFIGSRLSSQLLQDGHEVRGVDCLTDYYAPEAKKLNLGPLLAHPRFQHWPLDLSEAPLDDLVTDVTVIFHQAGQPGVRSSWGETFRPYVRHNIMATQRLLEAARDRDVQRFVFASSSSIYGDADRYPTDEADLPRPISPYGVSKLSAEHLVNLYGSVYGVPTVSLRYFTVYGPGQRPDMAFHRFINAGLAGQAVPLYGDGLQVRDFTYVGDIVRANVLAASSELPVATVINVAGGTQVSVLDVITLLGTIIGHRLEIDWRPAQAGDVRRTGGATRLASELLGWAPTVELHEGLNEQVEWHRSRVQG